jgi:lysyl-tRNA synthetase, class II
MAFTEQEITQWLAELDTVITSGTLGERELNEMELQRIQSLRRLVELKINPYPAEKFEVTNYAIPTKENYNAELAEQYKTETISLAGRIMSVRGKGKASFAELQDCTGRIQLYVGQDSICPGEDKTMYEEVFKRLLDIGDYIGVEGYVFTTKTGEISIHVSAFKFLSKAIRTLPIVKTDAEGNVYDAFLNPELRYRMRYVDLTVNPQFKNIFVTRSKVLSEMRRFFDAQGWMEVETPILQAVHGGAAARPFETHHNTLDADLYLRIANELYLKRLIVAGFDGVYEIGKMFRNEGMDRTHNPEFTSMEIYVAYKDYIWMMEMVEQLFEKITTTVHGKTAIEIRKQQGKEFTTHVVDFKGPFEKLSIYEAIQKHSGHDVSNMNEEQLRALCRSLNIEVDPSMGRGKLIDEIFGETTEQHLIQPTFIIDYPIEMTPLAKKHRTKEGMVERFELFVMGKEIANAYTELNDPIDQRRRFEDQLRLAERGDEEAMAMDEDFLRALEFGMPPTSGLGIGIDRLTMLMTNQTTIQEVLFFPQMKPEPKQDTEE